MSLNIKNEDVHSAVRELATVLGVNQTSAVEIAVRAKLDALRADSDRVERERRIREAIERWQSVPGMSELPDPDFLYDPVTGMPR